METFWNRIRPWRDADKLKRGGKKKKKVGHSRGREKNHNDGICGTISSTQAQNFSHTLVSQAQERSNDILIPGMKSILQHRTTLDTPLNKIPEFYIQSLPGSRISRYNFCYSPKEYTWWSDWFDIASYYLAFFNILSRCYFRILHFAAVPWV